jgi:hypothetical protein
MSDGLTMMERLKQTGSMLPKGVAFAYSSGRNGLTFVTHADLKRQRIAKQRTHLAWVTSLESEPCRRAALIWTFFVPGTIYGGWHLYLRTITRSNWIRPSYRFATGDKLEIEIMTMFPCGLLPIPENICRWKEAFAHTYPCRTKRGGKPQGVVFGWADCTMGDATPRNFIPRG